MEGRGKRRCRRIRSALSTPLRPLPSCMSVADSTLAGQRFLAFGARTVHMLGVGGARRRLCVGIGIGEEVCCSILVGRGLITEFFNRLEDDAFSCSNRFIFFSFDDDPPTPLRLRRRVQRRAAANPRRGVPVNRVGDLVHVLPAALLCDIRGPATWQNSPVVSGAEGPPLTPSSAHPFIAPHNPLT